MEYGVFGIAEKSIRIFYRDSYLPMLCRDYRTGETDWDFTIKISQEELEEEKKKAVDLQVSDGYLESLAVCRKLCDHLLEDQMFLFHCSAVGVDGEAILFTAPSGTGKSTQAALWKEAFPDRVRIVNDDKPFLKVQEDQVLVYGTPWCGKHGWNTNCVLPVRAVILLEQGTSPRIARKTPGEVFPYLYQQMYHFQDADKMRQALELFNKFLLAVPVYKLQATIGRESVEAVYRTVFGEI